MSPTGATAGRPPSPGWLIGELGSAGRENLDAAHVQPYDRKMDAQVAEEVGLLMSWGLDGDSVVVDLGCGTGQFALAAAKVCRRVVAVDVSPLMLAKATAKRDEAGSANLEMCSGGFLTYEHIGESADSVYSRYALHHLPDLWKAMALERMRVILRPGGILRLWDIVYHFAVAEAPERIEAWCSTPGQGDWGRWELEDLRAAEA